MKAALTEALRLVAAWSSQHTQSYPPTIVHLTDGESSDGDPSDVARSIHSIGTTDGRCLLFNIHVSIQPFNPNSFPNEQNLINTPLAKLLFEMSSVVPENVAKLAKSRGYRIDPGARGYVFNADAKAIVDFFDISSQGVFNR